MTKYSYKKALEAHNRVIQQAPDFTAKHILAQHKPEKPRPFSAYILCCEEYICASNDYDFNHWPCAMYIYICELHNIQEPIRQDLEADDENAIQCIECGHPQVNTGTETDETNTWNTRHCPSCDYQWREQA